MRRRAVLVGGALRALAIATLVCLGAAGASAATLTVNTTADSSDAAGSCGSGTCSLRDAISQSSSGDTINFSVTGTITLGATLPNIEKNLTITGPGASQLTISGAGSYRIMTMGQTTNPTVTISGLTFADGTSSSAGGAIYSPLGSTLTLIDCAFLRDSAYYGGALNNGGGTLTITGSSFIQNSATHNGGAIIATWLVLTNNTFYGNSSLDGGAVYFSAGGTITNNTFADNSASNAGGAILADGGLTANNNIFTSNSSKNGGAGIVGVGSSSNAAYNVFYNNLTGSSEDDCYNCASNSNATSAASNPLALPLGYYGGTTETYLPQPGSAAICAGSASLASSAGLSADQRGFAMNPAYTPCASGSVDAGAVQTNYILVQASGDSGSGSADCQGISCTLRDAVALANSNGYGDIDFASGVSSITLGSGLTLSGTTGVNIVGPGANSLTVNGGGSSSNFSVFTVDANVPALIYGLTISNGNIPLGFGGGIHNLGSLTVAHAAVSGNSAFGGGGIDSGSESLTVVDSTISGNPVSDSGGGILTAGTATILESTIAGNSTSALGGTSGGGIDSSGTLSIVNSTIAGNAQQNVTGQGGGGIYVAGGTMTLANSVVAGNTDASSIASNILNSYTGEGGNVVGGNSNATSSLVGGSGAAITMSPLQLNGIGATVKTMIPLPGSAAICAGATSNIPSGTTTDERGYPLQPTSGYCSSTQVDAGAVQTNYTSIQWTQEPSNVAVSTAMAAAPAIQVLETDTLLGSNNTDGVNGIPLSLTLTNGNSNLTGASATTAGSGSNAGTATFSSLRVSQPEKNDQLNLASVALGTASIGPLASTDFNVIGPATQLGVGAASPEMAGTPFSVTVTAEDAATNTAAGYTGTVKFTTSDPSPSAVLPSNYTFVAGDNGVHTFANVTLATAGSQTITATDTATGTITGVTSITVNAAAAALLTASGGSGQSAYVNLSFGTALSASVTDAFGNPVGGTTVTFTAPSSGASAALSAGSCVTAANGNCTVTATANGTAGSYNVTASVSGLTSVNFALTNNPTPNLVVTSTGDDAGTATNCTVQLSTTSGTDASCSLRDALLEAASLGTANIYFDATKFAGATTITLTNDTLAIPANTSVLGPGANKLTISGANSYLVFSIGSGNANLSSVTVANGSNANAGGLLDNSNGTVVINQCAFVNNTSTGGLNAGAITFGGSGTLDVKNSTFTGNSDATYGASGAVTSSSSTNTLNVVNSTFYNNSGSFGGGVGNFNGPMTVVNSTFYSNSGTFGEAIYASGTSTVANNVFVNNTGGTYAISANEPYTTLGGNVYWNNAGGDCFNCTSAGGITNSAGGIHAASNPLTLPLWNYGGTTETYLPQPGSEAICAGSASTAANAGITADQRGVALSLTASNASSYTGAGAYCAAGSVDAGAVQTDYALNFTAQQPSSVVAQATMTPAPIVTITESGSTFTAAAVSVGVTDAASDLTGTSTVSALTSGGQASFSNLAFTNVEASDTLTATVALTASANATVTSNTFSVTQISQTITFNPAVTTYTYSSSGTFALSATASSTLAVSFASTTGSVCSVSGTTVTMLAAGTCTIQATQAGDTNYSAAAPVSVDFTISQASQSITFTAPASPVTYGVSPITLSATGGNSGNAIVFTVLSGPGTISGSTLSVTGAGTIVIAANQLGNTNYSAAAQVTQSIVVNQASQTITFTAPASVTYGVSPISLSATGGNSGNAVTFSVVSGPGTISGSTLTVTGTGTIVIAANQAGNTNYSAAAQVTQSIVVNQASQTITFTAPASVTYGVSPISLSATGGNSGNAVTFSVVSGPGTISGSTLTVTGAGTIVIAANQAGNTNYSAAAQVTQSVVIAPAPLVITASSGKMTYGGTPPDVTPIYSGFVRTDSSTSLTAQPTCSTAATSHSAVGSYASTCAGAVDANYSISYTAGSVTVTNAALAITANNATKVYGTANPAFAGTVTGAVNGDSFVESFATAATSSSDVGAYPIVPSVTGSGLSNYTETVANGTLTITQAATTTTVGVSSASITPGQSVTLTADVASATTGTPSGTVSFYDGTTLLDTATLTSGAASYSTSVWTPGVTHTITATYNGSADFSGSSATSTATVVVAPLDFTMTLSLPANLSVVPGKSVSFPFTVTPDYGSYAGTMTFALRGLPFGATASFSPASIAPGSGPQTVTVTIQTTASAASHRPSSPTSGRAMTPLALAFLLLFGVGSIRARGRVLRRLLCVLVVLAGGTAMVVMNGCGARLAGPLDYPVTLTATAGNVQHSTTFTLKVQ